MHTGTHASTMPREREREYVRSDAQTSYCIESCTLCMIGNFDAFLECFLLIFFFKKNNLSEIPSECQSVLDPDQAEPVVRTDLGPNFLQRISAEDTSRRRVISIFEETY